MHKIDSLLADYLAHLGMPGDYEAHSVPCEVCGEKKNTVIREIVDIGMGAFGKHPVVACDCCGFLFQNLRFDLPFYKEYYSRHYRNVVYKNPDPSQEFIADQLQRGKLLFENLKKYLPARGNLLDAGCSVGGNMIAFMNAGWDCYGTDPDSGFVRYGSEKMNLPVEEMLSEDMKLRDGHYDLIMIMGSLEHVFDPNKVLAICRKACKPKGFLILEGRGKPQSASKKYFNHNHHRYLSLVSMQLLMKKHGWEPVLMTEDPIAGPTRPGSIFCLGQASKTPSEEEFVGIVNSGLREDSKEILRKFDELDRLRG